MDGVYTTLNKIKILFLILTITILLSCSDNKNSSTTDEPILIVHSETQQRRTENSPLVASKNGVSQDYLRWIDESFDNLTRDISAQNRDHNIYSQAVILYILDDCVLSPEQRVPSFLIRADDYDGTQFDQDPRPGIGKIYAAEYVIQEGNVLTNEWVICNSTDETYVKNASRYGYEHKFLYDWYRSEYEATKFHGNGVSHPLIPDVEN